MLTLLLASPALAAFVSTQSVFLVPRPPASVEEGRYENQALLGGWVEAERLRLPRDVAVDVAVPGTYGVPGGRATAPGVVPAGTYVTSHYLHGDSTGQSLASWDGFATFDAPIVGLMLDQVTMEASDALFNVGGVVFDTQPGERDFDTDLFNDRVTWDPNDPFTIVFDHAADTGMDELRVLTLAYWVDIGGACPGQLDIRWGGMTPGGVIAFVTSPNAGALVVPSGPCAGTQMGLGPPATLRGTAPVGPAGWGALHPMITSPAVCSHLAEAVDMASCVPSGAIPLP
ncbi:MAG TPA: hypothetical protein PKA64_09235 [Myxococcota bacterium]|nr:hypothetical protein [Myxococcota bacterium]